MKMKFIYLVSLVSCTLLCTHTAAEAKCPSTMKKGAFVYAVGSSTLGSPLGQQLDGALSKAGLRFRKWAKASSGLARPDFHDWTKRIAEVNKQHSPDAYIISLGTNDYQAIYHRKKWIKVKDKERWIKEYTARVDQMLALASGPDKNRLVVWVGPVPFNTPKGRNMSLRINRILKERIAAFDGPAVFIDMRSKLMSKDRPTEFFRDAAKRKKRTYRKDNVHLTIAAVQHLMTNRITAAFQSCIR